MSGCSAVRAPRAWQLRLCFEMLFCESGNLDYKGFAKMVTTVKETLEAKQREDALASSLGAMQIG